jgi:hypothetical protein
MTTSRFSASGFTDESWASRFHAPRAMQAPFASPPERTFMEASLSFVLSQRWMNHRSDACRAGRCSDLPKVRCTSKYSLVRARTFYVRRKSVGLIAFKKTESCCDAHAWLRAGVGLARGLSSHTGVAHCLPAPLRGGDRGVGVTAVASPEKLPPAPPPPTPPRKGAGSR